MENFVVQLGEQRNVQLEMPLEGARPEKRWAARNGRLNEYERALVCFSISTKMPLSAEESFEYDKQRHLMAVGFLAFQDDNQDRLHSSVCGYRGKLLCHLLVQAFVLCIRKNAQNNPVVEGNLVSLPHDSVPEMLRNLETVHISRRKPADRWLVHQPTPRQRGYLTGLFKIKTPPRCL